MALEDWDVDRVDLKWVAPKNDGGAAITGYIIERKEKLHSSWDEVLTTSVNIVSKGILMGEKNFFTGFNLRYFFYLLDARMQSKSTRS